MGSWEFLTIILIALIIYGPKKAPEIARKIGMLAREYNKTLNQASTILFTGETEEDNKLKIDLFRRAVELGIDIKGKSSEEIAKLVLTRIVENQTKRDLTSKESLKIERKN